jgi:N-acetyl-gamma-glutamyl-phosphate reductase
MAPLVQEGVVDRSIRFSAVSLTGFSGGGKKMIADYGNLDELKLGGRQYALSQQHKHLPEIVKLCGLEEAPAFIPVVVPHYSGMEVTIPLFAGDLKASIADIKELYTSYYSSGLVRFADNPSEDGFLSSAKLSGSDAMELSLYGNDERIILVSRFDNLGKGASGAAIQNMNIAIGADEVAGLVV